MKNRTNILITIASATALLTLAACEQKSSKPATTTKTESAAKSAGESAGKAASEGAKAASETQKAVSEAGKDMPKEE